MHDLFKPYIIGGISYIDRNILVDTLIKNDSTYYIDDLNYLTIAMDCLCGYIPGTDLSRNFSYLRAFHPVIDENGNTIENSRVGSGIIISCRDPEVLEMYLDLHYKHRLHKRFSVNIPIEFSTGERYGVETVRKLLEKYNGYYKFSDSSPIFDYRFPDPGNIPIPKPDERYKVKNELYAGYTIIDDIESAKKLSWVLYKGGSPLFCEMFTPYCEDLGLKAFSFSNMVDSYDGRTVDDEDIVYFRRYIASKFAKDGYIIKSVACNFGFDNERIYEQIGMTRYRSFITLETNGSDPTGVI